MFCSIIKNKLNKYVRYNTSKYCEQEHNNSFQNKWIYYVPLYPRPKLTVDDQFLEKLKPDITDGRFVAEKKLKLYDYFAEGYYDSIKYDYRYSILKWNPHYITGSLFRGLIFYMPIHFSTLLDDSNIMIMTYSLVVFYLLIVMHNNTISKEYFMLTDRKKKFIINNSITQ